MTLGTLDRLKRTRMIMKREWTRMKQIRDALDSRASDVLWLKNRYTSLIIEMNTRIMALDQEIQHEEEAEKEREASRADYHITSPA